MNKFLSHDFRIYVDKRTFFRVMIFRDHQAMWRYGKELHKKWNIPIRFNLFYARSALNYNRTGQIGHVILCDKWRGAGIVTHELAHCAFHVLRMKGYRWPLKAETDHDKAEERYCQIIEKLGAQYRMKAGAWAQKKK